MSELPANSEFTPPDIWSPDDMEKCAVELARTLGFVETNELFSLREYSIKSPELPDPDKLQAYLALSTRLYEHSPRQHTSGLEHLTERQGLWLLGALALHQYGDSGSALRELDYLTQDMVDARTEHAHLEQVQAIYQYISVEAAHSSA